MKKYPSFKPNFDLHFSFFYNQRQMWKYRHIKYSCMLYPMPLSLNIKQKWPTYFDGCKVDV